MPTSEQTPNHRLAAKMREAGATNKGLAKRMRDASAQDDGEAISPTHTTIAKYLSGQIAQPSERSCHVMVKVLSHTLGRPLTLDDIGYARVRPEQGDTTLSYPETIGDSITALTQLTDYELNQADAASKLLVVPEAWASLLVKALYGDDREPHSPSTPVQLSPIDVREVHDATEMFSTFDHRYGGGQSKPLVAKYLQTAVLPLIPRVSQDNQLGRDYFQAVASLTLRAGWTAYDIGEHAVAQRFLYQAYRLARAARDKAFAGHVLACMSHQANFLGHFEQAVHLARGASHGATGHATPTAMAMFNAMEARALASRGDEHEAVTALSVAEKWLNNSKPANDPAWIWFFDEAELHAEFAHCFRDLGNAEKASQHAATSMEVSKDEFVRSLSFCRSVLATSHLLADDLDQAVHVASGVIDTAAHLKSYRVISYLNDFRQQLGQRSNSAATRAFDEYFSEQLGSERSPIAGRIIVS